MTPMTTTYYFFSQAKADLWTRTQGEGRFTIASQGGADFKAAYTSTLNDILVPKAIADMFVAGEVVPAAAVAALKRFAALDEKTVFVAAHDKPDLWGISVTDPAIFAASPRRVYKGLDEGPLNRAQPLRLVA